MQLLMRVLADIYLPISAFSGALIATIVFSIISIIKIPHPEKMKRFRKKEILFSYDDWKPFYKKISIYNLVVSIVVLIIYLVLFFLVRGTPALISLGTLFILFIIYAIVIEVIINKKFKKLNEEAKQIKSQESDAYSIFDNI